MSRKQLIAELTKCIKEAHSGFKYKCSQCERLFDTYNGRTKHENKHYFAQVCLCLLPKAIPVPEKAQ